MAHPIPSEDLPPIDRLLQIMHILRAPGGCPWDAEQTHDSLAPHLIEEAYEVAAAIRSGDPDAIADELGDILLQPVFHAEIASEKHQFNFDDIAGAICEKLIRRHPHVFGDSTAGDPQSVLSQWEQIKAAEKNGGNSSAPARTLSQSLQKAANEGIPSLMAARKIQSKVATVGFDWDDIDPVIDKIREEIDEVTEALQSNDADSVSEEIGDLLFAVVNLARKTGNEAELLLDAANRKFVDRFQRVEEQLAEDGLNLKEASLEQMDAAWEKAKH